MNDRPQFLYVLVTTPAGLEDAAASLASSPVVALDTESDNRHHYPERVALVQAAAPGRAFILDPLALPDLSPLGAVLADASIEKVLHGADYDLRGLDRDWGFACAPLFDTYIAAKLAGQARLGLAALLEDLLGVAISKDPRTQQADWSRRPLSKKALEYAVADVLHLCDLRDALADRLHALGRWAWAQEEFARLETVRHVPPDPEQTARSIKEARGLDGQGLAVLRELVALREQAARRLDRPPSLTVPNAALAAMAADPDRSAASLLEAADGRAARAMRPELEEALRRGLEAEPLELPRSNARPTSEQVRRLARLKEWRRKEGKRLEMDPSLLWPMRSLERLAREPDALERELESPEVRRWQREAFGDGLRRALA